MADANLNLNIKATGAEATQRAVSNVARSAESMKSAIQPNAGAASAWNPYIAALKKIEEAQSKAAEVSRKHQAALQPNAGAASAWNPFISAQRQAAIAAEKQAAAAQKQAAANQAAISAGAASKWSPQIGAVKQLEAAQNAAAEAARKLADANAKAQSAGLASAWSPQIAQARQMQTAAANASLGRAAAYVPAGGRLHSLNQSMVDAQAASQDRYGALAGAASTYGKGALLVGAGGTYALGRAAVDAGNLQQTRRSIESYEGGKELYQNLLQFDKSSPMNLQEVLSQGQSALAQDFKASEIVPIFNTLGDAVVKAGGSTQEFTSAMVQISQIKNKGVASMQDIRAMAEGAKLPVIPILKEALGDARVNDILSGDEPISADELFKHLFEGLKKRSEGAMQEYMDTLPGALGELESSFFMLRTEVGEYLVPIIKVGVKAIQGVVDLFRAMPGPLKSIVAVGGGVIFGLTALAGGLLTAVGPMLNLIQTIAMLRNAQAASTGVQALATASGGLGPAVQTALTSLVGAGGLTSVLTVALPAAIAIGAALMLKSAMDAASAKADERAEGVDTAGSSKFDGSKQSLIAEAEAKEKAAEKIDETIKERKGARDWSSTFNIIEGQWRSEIEAEIKGLEAEKASLLGNAARLRRRASSAPSEQAKIQSSSMAAQAQIVPGTSVVAAGIATYSSTAGSGNVSAIESDILNLQREMRNADKDRKKVLADQLAEKRVALKNAKAAAAQQKRDNKAAEKAKKEQLKARIEEDRNELDVKSAEEDESFQTRIAQLEAERDAAREAKNVAREAQLKFEIDKLNAEREYALAKIRADGVALEDEKKADSMMRIAEAKKKGALQRAQISYNSARNKGAGNSFRGGILPGLPSGLQTLVATGAGNAGAVFNPYANARYEGDDEPFTRMVGTPHRPENMTSMARNISAKTREWVARAKTEIQQSGNGMRTIRIVADPINISDPVQDMGGRL